MTPLVSILTPAYNHARYLDNYVGGLLAQTYPNIELIIIDDASTDATWDRLCSYRERLHQAFTRLILKRHSRNLGLIPTLNELKNHIRGDFVAILESDDYYKPDKVAANVAFLLANPTIGAVYSDVDFLYPDREQPSHWAALGREMPQGEVYEPLLFDNFILTCTFCCRADLFVQHANFEAYARRGYLTADYPLFLDLARHTRFGYLDRSLAVYRVVENSISHPRDLRQQFRWKKAYYQTKLDYIERYGARREIVQRARRQYHLQHYWFGYWSFSQTEFNQGYAWLKAHYPAEFNRPPHRLRALSMKHKALWEALRRAEQLRI